MRERLSVAPSGFAFVVSCPIESVSVTALQIPPVAWLTCCASIAIGDAPPEVSVFSLLSFALGFPNGLKMSEACRLTAGGFAMGFGADFFEVSSLATGCLVAAMLALAWLSITFN